MSKPKAAPEQKPAVKAGKKEKTSKAARAAAAMTKGVKTHKHKIRTSVRFRVKKTQSPPVKARVPTRLVPKLNKMDDYRILKTPLTTEAALKKVANANTLVFLCDPIANKAQIRAAVARRYNVKVLKCNTLIRPDGKKKAFVRLHKDYDALDIANKIGVL
eukprot:Blabericola_migrator_1__7983@NODE_409_length_8743_cov_452_402259_g322_i0_p7_GENE_NODE_409_length_8743_cov_452_402259_g322_i0NODE_409_length_8743_cov_452_402259_g322_i0_p7_ORF_typecomplete_len160_score32_70Ribosomal_L23/PF00276_20/3_3e03Ribosomal_L23/PF00276_20/4_4e18Ribosomal_L23eN/PF03939_13/7_1e05Ribosomal_L23eN/PF03939_13/1_8e04Ribosomal_L23eN/PF03939_13/5_6e03Hydin_ADK/PF17213_3/2_5e02Hydin_ADK/PF17213_3/0_69_NODE_409_length_8743_cov_452_402259_g322_i081368615